MGDVKQFRIEKMMGFEKPTAQSQTSAAAPTSAVAVMSDPPGALPGGLSLEELASLRDRVSEAARLQAELMELSAAIEKTKCELSALHYEGSSKVRFQEAGNELDAVVNATEAATDIILTSSEKIDSAAAHLSAAATDDVSRAQADEIAELVVTIFEACNFQDITGQRITKVVSALHYIDERVSSMMEIWGGAQDLAAFAPKAEEREGDEALLNGPALEEHHGHASQDDIDALFA
ncbi:protein phosphatase CheZ [Pyruvatibacter sp.]|uniref:protein phosphatase CheZ n=1 Tax=Pyruvatibacter sp. TaxID=1981328 RepID=UPI0032EBE2A9